MRESKSKLIKAETLKNLTYNQRKLQKTNKTKQNRLKNETNLDLRLFSKKITSRYPDLVKEKVSFNDLIDMIIESKEEIQLFYLIKALSKVLAGTGSIFNEDFNDEVLDILLKYLENPRFSSIILDCLINLSVCNAQTLVSLGILSQVIHFASLSVDDNILDKSLWVLANISSDSIDFRDEVIQLKGIDLCFLGLSNETIFKNALFCISNLCRGRPVVSESICKKVVKKVSIFFTSTNEDSLKSLYEIVFSCSSHPKFQVPSVFPVDTLINMTENPRFSLICLKILNNFLFSDEKFGKYFIEKGLLNQISKFLEVNHWEQTEALLMMVNFSSGNSGILEKISQSQAFRKVLDLLKSSNFDVRLDALNVVQRVAGCKSGLSVLLAGKGLSMVIECCQDPHPDIVTTALKIIQLGLTSTKGKKHFEKINGLKRLQGLRGHPNTIVPEMLEDLIKSYSLTH
jgi:hypothetical protein